MIYNRETKLIAHCIGSKVFARDDNTERRFISLNEQVHQTGRQMLSLQQRIWELDEEITINEGKEQLQFILKQNELRKQYANLRKEKEGLESGKITVKSKNLDDEFHLPLIDEDTRYI